MGCICSKVLPDECSEHEHDSSNRTYSSRNHLSELKISRAGFPKSEKIWEKDRLDCSDVSVMLFDTKANGPLRSHGELPNERKKKADVPDITIVTHPCMGKIPNATEAEQVAAGWPSWLAKMAGEAIKGWLPKHANNFIKLEKACSLFEPCSFMLTNLQLINLSHSCRLAREPTAVCIKLVISFRIKLWP